MPFCAYCGTEVALGLPACPECGHPQSVAPASLYVPAEGQTTDGMAIASLVTALIGCFPVGLVLGIMSLRRIRKDPAKKGEGLAMGGIALGAASFLVIPILVAIAIPTFLGARARAQDRAAEVALHESLGSYQSVLAGGPLPAGTELTFLRDGESSGPSTVSFVMDGPAVRLAVKSLSGKCMAARHDGVETVAFALVEDAVSCRASAFAPEQFTSETLPLGQP